MRTARQAHGVGGLAHASRHTVCLSPWLARCSPLMVVGVMGGGGGSSEWVAEHPGRGQWRRGDGQQGRGRGGQWRAQERAISRPADRPTGELRKQGRGRGGGEGP